MGYLFLMQLDSHIDALIKILVLCAIDADFDIKGAGCHLL